MTEQEHDAVAPGAMADAEDNRIHVAVSPAMGRFRKAQTQLNAMLWSTEICYGHLLATVKRSEQDVWSLFSHAPSQAWFPNKEGKIKCDKTTTKFLGDVKANMKRLHAFVLAGYYAHFEAYRVERLTKAEAAVPFLIHMARNKRLSGEICPNVDTVLLADLSRLLRNRIAHRGPIPMHADDAVVTKMCESFLSGGGKNDRKPSPEKALATWEAEPTRIRTCFNGFVRSVAKRCHASSPKDHQLTHEYFYTLFTFTHLDNLAFEIEEALYEPKSATAQILRAPERIRNGAMKEASSRPLRSSRPSGA
jgi:hypothetical protein